MKAGGGVRGGVSLSYKHVSTVWMPSRRRRQAFLWGREFIDCSDIRLTTSFYNQRKCLYVTIKSNQLELPVYSQKAFSRIISCPRNPTGSVGRADCIIKKASKLLRDKQRKLCSFSNLSVNSHTHQAKATHNRRFP